MAAPKQVVISQRAEDDLVRVYTHLRTQYDMDVAERFRVRAEKPSTSWANIPTSARIRDGLLATNGFDFGSSARRII